MERIAACKPLQAGLKKALFVYQNDEIPVTIK